MISKDINFVLQKLLLYNNYGCDSNALKILLFYTLIFFSDNILIYILTPINDYIYFKKL